MYSRRLDWQSPINRLAALADAKRSAGARLYDLTPSNPTRVGIQYPEAAWKSLADARALVYSPDPQGDASARAAVADSYRARGANVDPAHLILCASTSEAYSWLFKLLCNPGDSVLAPRPSYPLFDFLAALEGVALRHYPLGFDGHWFLDGTALERALGPDVRAVLLVNPNNPTGHFLRAAEVDFLVELAARHDLALIVDEVFSDYLLGPAAPDVVRTLVEERRAPTFVLSGLSKVVGLPQHKLGWIHVGGPDAFVRTALARLELVADTYLSVSTAVQHAAPSLLALRETVGAAIAARVSDNLLRVQQALAGTPVTVLPVDGGWYATLALPRTRSDEEWALALLERDDVVVQPGYFYDFDEEARLVVSLLTPPDVLDEGLRRLLARVG